jgi:DNA-binding NtrC family response regulator
MRPRIAVFDTAPSLLKLFQYSLASQGYEVSIFSSELNNIEALEKNPPQLIIVGYLQGYLPEELAVIQKLRSHLVTRFTPVVIATTGDIQRMMNYIQRNHYQGVYALGKPFTVQNLFDCIKQALYATA